MYRPPVSIAWNKGKSNIPLSGLEKPSAKSVDELPSWQDMSRHPTLPQVIALKRHFLQTLPIELVDIILSFADYWPHVSNSSTTPRTIKGKKPHLLPPPDIGGSVELQRRWRKVTIKPDLAELHTKDNLLVLSSPLGLSQETSHPWLPPKTQNPARMLVVEVTARRVIPAAQVPQRLSLFRTSHTWLDIGAINLTSPLPQGSSLSPSDFADNALPKRPSDEAAGDLMYLQLWMAYCAWFEQRKSRVPGSLRLNLPVNEYPEGESRTTTSVYRFDDDDLSHSNPSGPRCDPWSQAVKVLGEAQREDFTRFVKALDDVERRDGAEFVRALRVGDEIGVWSRVKESDRVMVIEGVRVTVFWEV